MKKQRLLKTIVLGLLLLGGVTSAWADDVCKISETGYASLAAAINASNNGDVIYITAASVTAYRNASPNNFTNFSADKKITIMNEAGVDVTINADNTAILSGLNAKFAKNTTGSLTIDCKTKDGSLFEPNANATLEFEGVTIKNSKNGAHKSSGIYYSSDWSVIDAKNSNVSITYDNVTFDGIKSHIIGFRATGGSLTIKNGFTFTNCDWTSDEYDGTIYISNASASITINDDATRTALSSSSISFKVYEDMTGDYTITGGGETSYFTIADGENYQLEKNGSDVKIKHLSTAHIGSTSYNTLSAAITAATDGDEIVLDRNDVVTSKITLSKNLTITPKEGGLTIKRSKNLGNNQVFQMATAGKIVTIGSDTYSMTIDGQKITSTVQLAEVTNGSLCFKNMTIKNSYTSNSQGVLCVKSNSGANITLTDVAFNGCQATASGAGVIFCGTDDALVLSGNNTFSNCTGYGLYLEKRFKVDATNGVTNTAPISLFVKTSNIALGGNVINNALSSEVTQFIIKNDGYGLYRTEDGRGFIRCCEGYPLQVTSAGAATLMLPYDSTIPAGVTCYKLYHPNNSDVDITATEVTGGTLSAHIPVLVTAAEGLYYMLNSTKATTATEFTASATYSSGKLTGVYQETVVPADNYILTKHGDAVGFRKADGSTNKVQAYRAYLTATYNDGSGNAREFFGIDFDGDVTAINAVEKKTVTDDGEVYNLQGVRMTGGNLPKGIYVKNGKKFVIK